MEYTIRELEAERDMLRGKIIDSAKWIIDNMQIVVGRLQRPEPGNIGTWGVLQGSAVSFDILCARYEQVKRHLEIIRAELETAK